MCVELMCEPVHTQFQHEYFYSTRTPSAPHPFLLTDAAVSSTMWHQNWFHQEHTNTLTWLILTNRAKKWGQCAGFQKKKRIKDKCFGVFFWSRAVEEGHSVLLVIPSNICLPSSVRSRFRAASERTESFRRATAHACSQAFSTSSHFCTYHIWAKLKASLTTATVNPFLSSPTLIPAQKHLLCLTQETSKTHPQTEVSFLTDAIISERDIHAKQTYWLHHHCKIWVPFKLQCVRRQSVLVEEWVCEQMHICGWERLGETD